MPNHAQSDLKNRNNRRTLTWEDQFLKVVCNLVKLFPVLGWVFYGYSVRIRCRVCYLARTRECLEKISRLDLRYNGPLLQGRVVIADPVDRLVSSLAETVCQYV